MTHDGRSNPTYAAFRFALIQEILSRRLKPNDVAEILLAARPKFEHMVHNGVVGGLGPVLDQEIELYRSMGDTWQPVNWTTGELIGDIGQDGRVVVEDHTPAMRRELDWLARQPAPPSGRRA